MLKEWQARYDMLLKDASALPSLQALVDTFSALKAGSVSITRLGEGKPLEMATPWLQMAQALSEKKVLLFGNCSVVFRRKDGAQLAEGSNCSEQTWTHVCQMFTDAYSTGLDEVISLLAVPTADKAATRANTLMCYILGFDYASSASRLTYGRQPAIEQVIAQQKLRCDCVSSLHTSATNVVTTGVLQHTDVANTCKVLELAQRQLSLPSGDWEASNFRDIFVPFVEITGYAQLKAAFGANLSAVKHLLMSRGWAKF